MPAEPAPSITTCCCDSGRPATFDAPCSAPSGNGRGALDVVVEGEQLVAVTLEDRQRVRGGEVLPLQQHVRQFLVHGRDEFVDERVVVVVADPSVPPAEILRVLEQFDVVGADVEHDRQSAGRMDAADQGVERKLADRDAHSADALVAQPEDALPVRHHDDVDVALGAVAQHLAQAFPVGVGRRRVPVAAGRSR